MGPRLSHVRGISLDRDPQRWQMIIASSINPETIDQTTDAYIPRSRRGVGLEPPMTANDGKAFDSDTGGLNITIERKKERNLALRLGDGGSTATPLIVSTPGRHGPDC